MEITTISSSNKDQKMKEINQTVIEIRFIHNNKRIGKNHMSIRLYGDKS